MESYIQWLKERHVQPKTITYYVSAIKQFQQWQIHESTASVFEPDTVSEFVAMQWKNHMLNDATYVRSKGAPPKPYSRTSIKAYLQAVHSYYEFLVSSGLAASNPFHRSIFSGLDNEEQQAPRWLTEVEKKRLLTYLSDPDLERKNIWKCARNRTVFYLALYAGLRNKEITSLHVSDIHFQERVLMIWQSGETWRECKMNDNLINALQEWIQVRGEHICTSLILTNRKEQFTDKGMWRLFNTVSEKVGIPDLSTQVLRHTFAHDMVEQGKPLPLIAEMMGINNLKDVKVYNL